MLHHILSVDTLCGFVIWVILGYFALLLFLLWYEPRRPKSGGWERDREISRAMHVCALQGGFVVGLIWLFYGFLLR